MTASAISQVICKPKEWKSNFKLSQKPCSCKGGVKAERLKTLSMDSICSTFTPFTQMYKWVPVPFTAGGNRVMDWHPSIRGWGGGGGWGTSNNTDL